MHLGYHGGACCGVKIIHSLGNNPEAVLHPIAKKEEWEGDLNYVPRHQGQASTTTRFYYPERPAEKAKDRLDAYLKYTKKFIPNGLIEVIVIKHSLDYMDQSKWMPILRRRGFRNVTKFYNSNSGNTVYVFHFAYGPKNEKQKEKASV